MASTSVDKALEVCEALSRAPRGASVGDLARALGLPPPTVHRLLAVLKRRGYVRQDEETQRYGLTLKMLDLSFRFLGRSEIAAARVPRSCASTCCGRAFAAFIAIPAAGEVTYVWATGPDEVAMRTVYGKEMPAHCALYFSPTQATRRLSCLRLDRAARRRATAPRRWCDSGRRPWPDAPPPLVLHVRAGAGLQRDRRWRGSACSRHGADETPLVTGR